MNQEQLGTGDPAWDGVPGPSQPSSQWEFSSAHNPIASEPATCLQDQWETFINYVTIKLPHEGYALYQAVRKGHGFCLVK